MRAGWRDVRGQCSNLAFGLDLIATLMTDAPFGVDEKQLRELHIRLRQPPVG